MHRTGRSRFLYTQNYFEATKRWCSAKILLKKLWTKIRFHQGLYQSRENRNDERTNWTIYHWLGEVHQHGLQSEPFVCKMFEWLIRKRIGKKPGGRAWRHLPRWMRSRQHTLSWQQTEILLSVFCLFAMCEAQISSLLVAPIPFETQRSRTSFRCLTRIFHQNAAQTNIRLGRHLDWHYTCSYFKALLYCWWGGNKTGLWIKRRKRHAAVFALWCIF